jgi:hypothetical protein
MGHFLFILLHVICFLFFLYGLLITIPLHLIYSVVGGKRSRSDEPRRDTHVRCPDCRELVLNEARKCKHCGAGLVPVSEQESETVEITRPR